MPLGISWRSFGVFFVFVRLRFAELVDCNEPCGGELGM